MRVDDPLATMTVWNLDATALRRGDSRSRLQKRRRTFLRCHGLAPWRLTLAANKKNANPSNVFCSGERETPRRKAVACAPESTRRQRGASPLQVYALRPETECNCVAKRRGGEQQEVNDQSVR